MQQLPLHIRQQVRDQIDHSLKELYQFQKALLKLTSGSFERGIILQFQLLNTFEAQRKQKRHYQIQRMLELYEQGVSKLQSIEPYIPSSFKVTLQSYQQQWLPKLMESFKYLDRSEKYLETICFAWTWKRLNANRVLVEEFFTWSLTQLEEHQEHWHDKVETQLAELLPITESEHANLAKEINDTP